MPVLSRVLGVTTIAFGALELAKPDLWAKPTGIVGPSPAMRAWHHGLGVRDVVSGLAMTFAPAGPALRAATLFRIVSDSTDALAFGINAPEARLKAKAVGAALGYAAVNALSLRWAGR
ncbi:hypothetical protein [Blastococcus sp. CT_GayMR16]|uniref:hypothetical protein n=1 Tax=Blastococcus sp. CT_GayMR16 TaxID=2559607 RepID=UPI0010735456|nr:hypothetical protein [Blastococcus sp. CT_GayMR16]TFV86317.1 hypothetical protein E4P38_17595 [Blastococcus sp. CT_GayMR16]